jgi:hypothetical protein
LLSAPMFAAQAQRGAPKPPAPAGGNALLYIGTYAGTIQIFDEATEQHIGDIKLATGIPRSLTLSQNRSRFYVMDSTSEKIETVDIAARTSLGSFTLSEGNARVRIRGFQVDPLERRPSRSTGGRSATWPCGRSTSRRRRSCATFPGRAVRCART